MSCDKHYQEGHLSISSSGNLATRCLILGSTNPTITDLIVSNSLILSNSEVSKTNTFPTGLVVQRYTISRRGPMYVVIDGMGVANVLE